MEKDMKLPEGKTCDKCFHWERCSKIFIREDAGDNIYCDFSPSRFKEKEQADEAT